MKNLLYVIAAVLGVLAGALVMHARLAPKLETLTKKADELQATNQKMKKQVEKLMKHGEQLEQQLARLKQAPPGVETSPVPVLEDELQAALKDTETSDDPAEPQRQARREFRRRGQAQTIGAEGEGEGEGEQDPGDSEERRARFRQFEQMARERVDTVLQDELQNAADATSQERIQNIQTYVDQLAQLRSEMRNAQTDEERDTLRQTMWETYGQLQELVHDQQNSMLRSFASNNGITDTAKQDAFITGLRDLQTTPFFQADRMFGGGGRGGPGGPWRPGFRGGGFFGGNPDAGDRRQ